MISEGRAHRHPRWEALKLAVFLVGAIVATWALVGVLVYALWRVFTQ